MDIRIYIYILIYKKYINKYSYLKKFSNIKICIEHTSRMYYVLLIISVKKLKSKIIYTDVQYCDTFKA